MHEFTEKDLKMDTNKKGIFKIIDKLFNLIFRMIFFIYNYLTTTFL